MSEEKLDDTYKKTAGDFCRLLSLYGVKYTFEEDMYNDKAVCFVSIYGFKELHEEIVTTVLFYETGYVSFKSGDLN
jgi:hypothetical protein